MMNQLEQARASLIEALRSATLEQRLDWIRTNPEEVKWKEGTIEQRFAMIDAEGVFATLSRKEDGSMELLIQVQETGCYREYEITKADGPEAIDMLVELYRSLPSTAKMTEDFIMIAERLRFSQAG
jgi:hypothetical protein